MIRDRQVNYYYYPSYPQLLQYNVLFPPQYCAVIEPLVPNVKSPPALKLIELATLHYHFNCEVTTSIIMLPPTINL
jgi:hypothetical protein